MCSSLQISGSVFEIYPNVIAPSRMHVALEGTFSPAKARCAMSQRQPAQIELIVPHQHLLHRTSQNAPRRVPSLAELVRPKSLPIRQPGSVTRTVLGIPKHSGPLDQRCSPLSQLKHR